MQDWNERLAGAGSVDQVMEILGEFLRHLRTERHTALLPSQFRHIVLTTPADVEWWLRELGGAPSGYGTGRMILQTTRGTFATAWERLSRLGYHAPVREAAPSR